MTEWSNASLAGWFTLWILIRYTGNVIFSTIKWNLLKGLGMTDQELRTIYSNRGCPPLWSFGRQFLGYGEATHDVIQDIELSPDGNEIENFDLNKILAKYPEQKIRLYDSWCRKGNHIYFNGLGLLLMQLVIGMEPEALTVLSVIQSIINWTLLLLAYNDSSVIGLGGLMYGYSARIRDGLLARANVLTASTTAYMFSIVFYILGLLVVNNHTSDDFSVLLVNYVYLPITFGDALGELIGGPFGKQKIKVWGVGQINKKSYLGTFMVFLGSLVPLMILSATVTTICDRDVWYGLSFVIATSTMFVELFAPRGTDNALIPFTNLIWCIIWVYSFSEFDEDGDCASDDD